MEEQSGGAGIPKATALRMPAYLRYLKAVSLSGAEYVSSASVAQSMGLSAVAVRKDFAFVSSHGRPRNGFSVRALIEDIEGFLGYRRRTNVVVVGAGKLGRAILSYEGFERYGLNVVAAFDVSPAQIGAAGGKPIYPMARLPEVCKRASVQTGILTVPREAAQRVAEEMTAAGIRAILSFSPAYLKLPKGVLVKYEDLAVSLATLCSGLSLSE